MSCQVNRTQTILPKLHTVLFRMFGEPFRVEIVAFLKPPRFNNGCVAQSISCIICSATLFVSHRRCDYVIRNLPERTGEALVAGWFELLARAL